MGRCLRLNGGPALLALVLLLGGCGQNTEKFDLSELRDPLIRKARIKADQGDQEGALACLNQALEKYPGLAQAHLDAGLLYDDFKRDYVRAAYHYQRYLELRPDTEKRSMIEELIRKDRVSLAASLSENLPGVAEHIKNLEAENARLKEDLRNARTERREAAAPAGIGRNAETGSVAAAERPAGQNAVKPAPALVKAGSPAAAPPAGQVYLVQERDTLSRIAAKVYRNPAKWKAIYEANRQTLGAPDQLRPGQSLVLPQP